MQAMPCLKWAAYSIDPLAWGLYLKKGRYAPWGFKTIAPEVGHGRGVLVALIKGQETLPAYCANEEGKRVARSSGDKKPASAKRASREQASLPVLDKNGLIYGCVMGSIFCKAKAQQGTGGFDSRHIHQNNNSKGGIIWGHV